MAETYSGKTEGGIQGKVVESSDGHGVVRFLRGKVFLVTGATGFLAKALVEKIIRSAPDVGKIYLLIRAKDKDAALERLKEIISTDLFDSVRQVYGKSYHAFMLSKLVPVIGNMSDSGLGMEIGIADIIMKEVDIIIHSAADTTLHQRYDVALDVNTVGPCRLLSFAKRCNKLSLFMHVSTAYANGLREGIIPEKKFKIGDSIARENNVIGYFPPLDVIGEIKMALNVRDMCQGEMVTEKMKRYGLERATLYGWHDVYAFTKALGEMMIESQRDEVPVVIVRPSGVVSAYKDPSSGWIEGVKLMDPLILSYGGGELTGFPADPNTVTDIVPVDMVVNAMLVAIAKHGKVKKSGLDIYHICSSVANPMSHNDLFNYVFEYFQSRPCMDSENKPIIIEKMVHFSSMHEFECHVDTKDAKRSVSAQQGMIFPMGMRKLKHMGNIYKPYMFYRGRFDNSNVQKLMEDMSEEESKSFDFDVRHINWKDYFCNIHVPGLLRYVKKRQIPARQRL